MTASARPSPFARALVRAVLRVLPLGDRRDDVRSDVLELFEQRRRTRGRANAYTRLLADLVSVTSPRAFSGAPTHRPPPRATTLGSWLTDLRYGLRVFRKHPAIIGATVGGLALAIGVGTTVFTIVNAGILRPYGMADPHSVVSVVMFARDGSSMSTVWPYHAFLDMRERARHARLEAFVRDGVRLSTSSAETPSHVDALLLVSGGYLPTLGAHAILGRTLQPGDDAPGAAPVAVLNHRTWAMRLHGDPQIVGKTIWLSGTPVTVVGVLESSFTGPVDNPPAVWAPFGSYAAIFRDHPLEPTSDMRVAVVARVEAPADRAGVTSELSAIAGSLGNLGLQSDQGATPPPTGVRLDGVASPMDGPDATDMLAVVGVTLAIVGLVIALACANVANLLLASAASRAREIGVRLALGASRGRILRQLLSESLTIACVAGAGGLLLSIWLVPIAASATGVPETVDLRPDLMVWLFTAAIAAVSGVGAGLTPARHAARGDLVGRAQVRRRSNGRVAERRSSAPLVRRLSSRGVDAPAGRRGPVPARGAAHHARRSRFRLRPVGVGRAVGAARGSACELRGVLARDLRPRARGAVGRAHGARALSTVRRRGFDHDAAARLWELSDL